MKQAQAHVDQHQFQKKGNLIRRLYDWVLHWAETPYGTWALGLNALSESSFFPVPPDLLLIALSLSKPKRSLWYALVCSMSSLAGGILGYIIGWKLWELTSNFFFTYVPGFTEGAFHLVQGKYEEHAFLAVFTAGFTPIPYKVFTIAAGVFQISLLPFLLASLAGRSMRFFLVAGLIRIFGEPIKSFIDKYFNLLCFIFVGLLILGFIVVKYLTR